MSTTKHLSLTLSTDKSDEDLLFAVCAAVGHMQDRTSDGEADYPVTASIADLPHQDFEDVEAFHRKFAVPTAPRPALLDAGGQAFRVKFMQEELDEFCEAYLEKDLAKAGDALVDLVYVALGTASMMGLPWGRMWDEVQRANMSKVRATGGDDARSVRKSKLDVVKPEGWTPPDHSHLSFGAPPVFLCSADEPSLEYPDSGFTPMD